MLPLWEMTARPPGSGPVGVGMASKKAWAETMPMVLGPMKRMPCSRAVAAISSSSFAPSAPISRKPDEMMTAAVIPFAPQSLNPSGMSWAGTANTARSTSAGMSLRLG